MVPRRRDITEALKGIYAKYAQADEESRQTQERLNLHPSYGDTCVTERERRDVYVQKKEKDFRRKKDKSGADRERLSLADRERRKKNACL